MHELLSCIKMLDSNYAHTFYIKFTWTIKINWILEISCVSNWSGTLFARKLELQWGKTSVPSHHVWKAKPGGHNKTSFLKVEIMLQSWSSTKNQGVLEKCHDRIWQEFWGESWMEFITHLDRFWEAKVVVGSMAKLLDWQWLSYLESWQLGGNVWYWLN